MALKCDPIWVLTVYKLDHVWRLFEDDQLKTIWQSQESEEHFHVSFRDNQTSYR